MFPMFIRALTTTNRENLKRRLMLKRSGQADDALTSGNDLKKLRKNLKQNVNKF
jgi:hypothetical protein